jgi:hypothetical protein
VRSKQAEYLAQVAEFILFLFLALVVWANAELCRYLIFHKKPTEHQFLWAVALYTCAWIVAGLLRDYVPTLYRGLQTLDLSQPPAVEQQPEA